jgi:hypothetical protein
VKSTILLAPGSTASGSMLARIARLGFSDGGLGSDGSSPQPATSASPTSANTFKRATNQPMAASELIAQTRSAPALNPPTLGRRKFAV